MWNFVYFLTSIGFYWDSFIRCQNWNSICCNVISLSTMKSNRKRSPGIIGHPTQFYAMQCKYTPKYTYCYYVLNSKRTNPLLIVEFQFYLISNIYIYIVGLFILFWLIFLLFILWWYTRCVETETRKIWEWEKEK